MYFDGSALISLNGEIVAQGSQFSVNDIEVIAATVDLEEVQSQRAAMISHSQQATVVPTIPRIKVPFTLSLPGCTFSRVVSS